MKKSIVLTGGGTAGHVTPNIALIPYLQADGWSIDYIGSENGIEAQLIRPLQGITYHAIQSGKLRRYFSLKNFTDPFRVCAGIVQARRLIKRIQPTVVFAKGGFVSVPVVMGARSQKVPVVLHESDYTAGLANRLCIPYSQTICVSFEPTMAQLKGRHAVWTGSPVRESLLTGTADMAQLFCRFANPEKPWILCMGGSQGSAAINEALRGGLEALTQRFNVVHLCGKGHLDDGLQNHPSYRQYEYVSEQLTHLYAASSLAVCRSGANSLFELLSVGLPSLLIPLPRSSSRGDQILNAQYFLEKGYAQILMQEDMTAQNLPDHVGMAFALVPRMKRNMAESPVQNGLEKVLEQIFIAAEQNR